MASCEKIGFKRGTESIGQCALKMYETEKLILADRSRGNSSSGNNTAANLFLLQQSLQLLNPPRAAQPRNFNCIFNDVGGIVGVNCY